MWCRSWLIDSRSLARKVINAGLPSACRIKDSEANTRCPKCHHLIDNSESSHEWSGFPAGVKFDPSDVELLGHLAAKRGAGNTEPHLLIDEFIPTLEGEGGICCTHPKNLPGAKMDGSSAHYFYRIANAYASGGRKRRRVGDQESARVRWHKTGKTKAVVENGIRRGFKKIMVLYETSKRGCKAEKCDWVMHQYHLGGDEHEKEGEYVVSKIFRQPEKESKKVGSVTLVKEESEVPVIPMTPKTTTPDPPRSDQTPYSDCHLDDYFLQLLLQESELLNEPYHASYSSRLEDVEFTTCLDENTEAGDFSRPNSLSCNEIVESKEAFGDINAVHSRDTTGCYGISELENLELDAAPDFNSQELQFSSQDSIFDSLDRLY
ncbi:SUPPRESSOR OF GAMMA RESPONSE 1-like isoform X1 [Salvia splendens]|uniref:SUPPRESSOR OF GAMMA RESPONSE 1-like isoform X1 n=1 Tax=Salvia splendens TaxID=180675 RepID=UPI0011026DDA|nr:SUPPRESSOR OF GAMMA RESPONSE 1-like isoform X1 [Salvia splendens]